jgi:hypothetical protein
VSEIAFRLEPSFASSGDTDLVLVIRLAVGVDLALDMLPYPSARRSVVRREVFEDARRKLGEGARRDRGILLHDMTIAGQPVPDLIVHPSAAPSRLNVDGFLGLDFFSQFDVVEWRPKTSQMRLTID